MIPLIKIVSKAEAEKADYVVCARKGWYTPFADNKEGICCKCGAAVVFRPYTAKTPRRICLPCVTSLIKARGEQ